MNIVILGLSITSSWGNGHATTYRSLIKGLAARGHRVLFLERDTEWYAGNRDEPHPAGAQTEIYDSLDELFARFEGGVRNADLVIVGSFVADGVVVGEWVNSTATGITAFYDIDTPVTLQKLEQENRDYLTGSLIRSYDLYLSFTGGPILDLIERKFGSPMARALYCSVDPELYKPSARAWRWDLGYLGTYSDDRQPSLEGLLMEPARLWSEGRFAVVGPMYPKTIDWPPNVERSIHLSPREHAAFYGAQRFTLNITRDAMKKAGFSPSVRLFEAAACQVPIISDWWPGMETILTPGREVLLSSSGDETLRYLQEVPDSKRMAIAEAARRRILAEHTSEKRAEQLEAYFHEARGHSRRGRTRKEFQAISA